MKRTIFASAILALLLLAFSSHQSALAGAVQVDPVIWQFDQDYPGANGSDLALPIRTVYVKTHDATDWMSTYDHNPHAVSGPDSVRSLIQVYGSQGIDVAAWFVPAGTDVDGQVTMAVQIIDSGVKALYADIEPFRGFCAADCNYLASTFWPRVRAERPDANLGVIYDPRSNLWDASGTAQWLTQANAALPMCYWETFAGQGSWGDPGDCVLQAHADLSLLAPGHDLDYIPMLQGDSNPQSFSVALNATVASGSLHASIWRRGVVPAGIWDAIAGYTEPPVTPPGETWPLMWGDADCNQSVTIGDAQKVARSLINLESYQTPPCPHFGAPIDVDGHAGRWADLDCDGQLTIGDAQKIARALLGLPITQADQCPAPGSTVQAIA